MNQLDAIVAYGNFRMGTNPTPSTGVDGQASNKLEFLLTDLTLDGYAFQDANFNSLYDAGTEARLPPSG